MKVFCLFLSVVLLVGPQCSYSQDCAASSLVCQQPLAEVELDFDKVINLDELEEEMVKMNIIDSIKPIPPHPLIVWLRIIGCPMANAYFATRRVFRNTMHKITAFFKIKSKTKAHEQSSAI